MDFLMAEYASDSNETDTDFNPEAADCAEDKTTHVPASSKDESSKAVRLEVHPSDTDNDKVESNKVNYFGLAELSDDTDEETNDANADTEKSQVVQVGDASVQVEIPSTSFWSDTSDMDIQALQKTEIIKKLPSESRRYLGKRCGASGTEKMSFSRSEMSKYENKASKRPMQDETRVTDLSSLPRIVDTGSVTDNHTERKLYFIHPKITPLLHTKCQHSKSPRTSEWSQTAHSGAVNRVQWCASNYSHLFASCSMDSVVKVWNIWSQLDPCVRELAVHRKAVKDVVWNRDGKQLLTASYDRTAAVTDVEKGVSLCQLEHTSYVTCAKYHPVNPHLCITGEHNQIATWDTRRPQVPCRVFMYKDSIGQIQDLLVSDDGSVLFSCSDLVTKDSSDRNVMAWDFATGVTLSNQIYQERYTVTRLKGHSSSGQFLAQSQGNYIAIFSMTRPYKICKHKRLEGHKLLGYSIGFDVTADGQTVYSGSSDGRVYRYNYQTGKLYDTLATGMDVVMDVACHPLLPSTLVVGSWGGKIQVWK